MLTRRDCQSPGEPDMSEDERIIVTLGYATQARGEDMRLRVALLQACENLCLASSITQRKRELYDVLMCLLQRNIEASHVHDTIIGILTDLISDLQRDTFSVQRYMQLASSLPMRPRGSAEQRVSGTRLQYMRAHDIVAPAPRPHPPPVAVQSPLMSMGGYGGHYMLQPMVFEETHHPLHIHIRMASTTLLQLKTQIDQDRHIRIQQQQSMTNSN